MNRAKDNPRLPTSASKQFGVYSICLNELALSQFLEQGRELLFAPCDAFGHRYSRSKGTLSPKRVVLSASNCSISRIFCLGVRGSSDLPRCLHSSRVIELTSIGIVDL